MPQANDMSAVEGCFGKHWDPTSAICAGGADHSQGGVRTPACSCEQACKTLVAHEQVALIPVRRLSEDRTTFTPPAPVAAPAARTPPTYPLQASTPAYPAPPPGQPQYQHAPQPHYPPAAPQAYAAHPHQGHYPATTGPVHFNPIAVQAPSFLSQNEPRKPGNRMRSFIAEMMRASAKGAAVQAASFFDDVPFGVDEDPNRR